MRESIRFSAPGKVHLLGEHVVVYNKPALITAVDRRCTVTMVTSKSSGIKVSSVNLGKQVTLSPEELVRKHINAQKQWERFRDGGTIADLKSITEDEMDFPLIAIGETLHSLKKDLPSGFSLSIDSEVPVGAGLGSSASTAVAVVAAMISFLGGKVDKNVVNDIAFLVEQKRHGLPSGGDNAAVTFGGLVWFRRETPELKTIQPVPFSVPSDIAKNFLLIDTGRPKESTGEMVAMVRSLYQGDKSLVEGVLNDQERLTRELLSALKDGKENRVMEIIKAGEANLEKLGVASPSAIKLAREIEAAGGVAKVCGAGGKTDASGVMLAYHQDKDVLRRIISKHKLASYVAALGAEGLRRE